MVVEGLTPENVVDEFRKLMKARPKKLITVSFNLLYLFHTKRELYTMCNGTKMLRDQQQRRGSKRKQKPTIARSRKRMKIEDVKMEIETIPVKDES